MKTLKTLGLSFCALLLTLVGCETDSIEIPDSENQIQEVEISSETSIQEGFDITNNSSLNESTIARYLGYLESIHVSNVALIFEEDNVVIDTDMVIAYDALEKALIDSKRIEGQRVSTATRASVFNSPIRYFIDPNAGIPNNWITAFRQATQEWEDLIGTDIRFTETFNATSANVTLTSINVGLAQGGPIASAFLPTSSSTVGRSIRVNISPELLALSTTPDQRRSTMMHEIGHTFGFRHTNGDTIDEGTTNERLGFLGSFVRCTRDTDIQSIMSRQNQIVAGQFIRGRTRNTPIFTDYDRIAILGLFRSTNPIITQVNGSKNQNQEGRLVVRWDRNRITSASVRITIFDQLHIPTAFSYTTANDGYDNRARAVDLHISRIPGYINRDNYYFGCLNVQIQDLTTGEIMDITGPNTFQFQSSGGGGTGGGNPRPRDYR